MRSTLAIAVLLFCIAGSRLSGDQNFARIEFKTAEQLRKDGDLEGAYRAYSTASDSDPANLKYAQKKAEVGAELCNQAVAKAKAMSLQDPTSAYEWAQRARKFNPSDQAAIQELRSLVDQAAAAQRALDNASASAYDGEAEKAQSLLESASKFRGWPGKLEHVGASVESVTSELDSLAQARRASMLASSGNTQQAVDVLLAARPVADSTSFAGRSLTETRRHVIGALLDDARTKQLNNLVGYTARARLLVIASSLDPTDARVKQLRAETITEFVNFVAEMYRPPFKSPGSADRYHLALLSAAAEIFGGGAEGMAHTLGTAYPALHVNIRIRDPRSCLSLDDKARLEGDMVNVLSPIAIKDKLRWDLEISVSEVNCSKSDIPRLAAQPVASTYVAGKTQLANPAYVQIQSTLSSAEANLNRAEAAYQANPTIANSFIQAAAIRQVRGLQNELARTPPYSDSEILQAYQYEIFQASRSVEFKGLVAVSAGPSHFAYSVDKTVDEIREDKKQGTSGVLPTDRSGVTNVNPVLTSVQDLELESKKEFRERVTTAVKSATAGFYASQASNDEQPDGDRLAATFYLSDLAKGTEYEEPSEELWARFRNRIEVDPESLTKLAKAIKFRIPEQASLPGPEPSANSIETALESVVSIETDQGVSGTGFFVGPHCSVVTNEHVISSAKTIILRTSKRSLYVAQILATDTVRDLAYLATNADVCTSLQLATGTAHIGTTVYAVGSPLGLEGTVTKGIVSANRLNADGVRLVQIDASLNPGNSGGPLIDQQGRVLGVNTFRLKDTTGLNFAVAADEVEFVFARFLGDR